MVGNKLYPYFFFYRQHCKGCFLITLICGLLIYQAGLVVIAPIIWLKAAVWGISIWYDLTFKKSTFYFYKNLGICKQKLYTVVSLADFLLLVLWCILLLQIR